VVELKGPIGHLSWRSNGIASLGGERSSGISYEGWVLDDSWTTSCIEKSLVDWPWNAYTITARLANPSMKNGVI